MNNVKSTKRALLSSILALILCFSMLLGSTFAWFTDTATSSGNIIQSGKLDVAMYWAEGDEDPAAVTQWNEAVGAIFSNDKWEPGYAEAKHIKIANEGTLALKYQMRIVQSGVVSELSNVIDVYFFADAKQLTVADFTEANKLGTLTEVLNVAYADNISNTIKGNLDAEDSKTVTLAFKMQESAGNEYQNLSIGSEFSIQLLATQYTGEEDSFGPDYDTDSTFPPQEVPQAMVYALSQSKLDSITIGGFNGATLDTGYSFQPTESFEQAVESDYQWAHADFFVYADATIPASSMVLAGYYKAFEGFSWGGQTLSETTWIGLTADVDIPGGAANGLRLLGDGMGMAGISYREICNYGNDGTGFLCGASDVTGENVGTTLTVELRVYKVACDSEGCHHSGFACETGEYEVIGTFEYTFGGSYETLADGSEVFLAEDGSVQLSNVANVNVENGTYYVPDGVTCIGYKNGSENTGYGWQVFAGNSEIKNVVFPDSVDTIAYQAFKGSAVESVTMNEGLTEISDFAFNGAKSLTSFNIPSTVTSIGKNSFRQVAADTVTIPANVETIVGGAFRDMPNLTTVTVEGNAAIYKYAFRSCANLTEVYLKGDDVTFPEVGQVFTHTDAGSAQGITVYVANGTVASRIYTACAADIAQGLVVKVGDNTASSETAYAQNNDALNTAIADGASTIVLGSGEYTIPDSAKGKDIAIVGNGSTTVSVVDDGGAEGDIDYSFEGSNVVFENVTLNIKGNDHPGYARMSATYNNCTITGSNYCLYGDSVFNNCTFNLNNGYVWTWGASRVEFNNCTFEDTTGGAAKAILVHNTTEVVVIVKDCTFKGTTTKTTWDGIPVAAVSIDPENGSPDATVYFEGTNTFSAAYNGLYQVKYNDEVDDVKVYVNGVLVDVPVGENDK